MKVLMFGWEFPPHITGGLGTACFGMTKGLAKNGVDVLFVVPKAHGDEDETNVRLLNASDVTVNIDNEKDRSYWDRVQYMEIGSNIIPYVGPERFEQLVEEQRATSHFQSPVFMPRYEFSGKYGANLLLQWSFRCNIIDFCFWFWKFFNISFSVWQLRHFVKLHKYCWNHIFS